ncbi:unnamed protein product, partial [Nesidiocoris tenuis]
MLNLLIIFQPILFLSQDERIPSKNASVRLKTVASTSGLFSPQLVRWRLIKG